MHHFFPCAKLLKNNETAKFFSIKLYNTYLFKIHFAVFRGLFRFFGGNKFRHICLCNAFVMIMNEEKRFPKIMKNTALPILNSAECCIFAP